MFLGFEPNPLGSAHEIDSYPQLFQFQLFFIVCFISVILSVATLAATETSLMCVESMHESIHLVLTNEEFFGIATVEKFESLNYLSLHEVLIKRFWTLLKMLSY